MRSANKPNLRVCPKCGTKVGDDGVDSLCPHCLMALNFAEDTEVPDHELDPNRQRQVLPEVAQSPDDSPGTLVGRYKIREKIGEGGWGNVYVAEQQQPVRRRVALKLIKPGMDTRNVVARFDAERQALALMDHPNIAKVFDGGATELGRPFFVMELVRGVRITDYCDQHHLSTRERLQLFIQVCHAIQHAHQKGVIHRDIKPSNILVMLADDLPVPKVIDFGIAKAVGERLGDKTTYTSFQQFIGTPAYTSPEQAGLSGLDVDTRSDIYALGVLLCELLTGRTPFEASAPAQAGVDDLLRRIRDEEAPRASALFNRLDAKERTTTAQKRSTEPIRLARSLRGDLDWIVMKCLEKNRTRRYATANDLARDIECYLNQKPVTAAAPSLSYRGTKWIRRHRRAVATTLAFALIVSAAVIGILWQAWRAGRAEAEQAKLRNVQWALETALPDIERSLSKDDYTAAFKLVEEARAFIEDTPQFQALADQAVGKLSISTEPAGAEVCVRDYALPGPDWQFRGKSPVRDARVSRGFKRWKITLPGYESAEGSVYVQSGPSEVRVRLGKAIPDTADMVRVSGEPTQPDLLGLDGESVPLLRLKDFYLERYEVTNVRYKRFVDGGGYKNPAFWEHKFYKEGVELSWKAAMDLFVDQTGGPGPATWKNGTFPVGQENYPVAGVSWYEAMAFARFANRQLPTVYHWSLAAGDFSHVDVGFLVPRSNFGSGGPVPVGTLQGMTSRGIYDMAGNVKEWCLNEAPDGYRLITGGGWNEPEYMFRMADKYPPFFRGPNFGFRCIKLPADDETWDRAALPVKYTVPPVLGDAKPCPDEVWDAYRRLYDYPRADLQPRLESSQDLGAWTRLEKASFNASYGNERMCAYIYLPRRGKPPFQTIVYYPGSGAFSIPSISAYGSVETYQAHTRHGRAFVFPVLKGSFERGMKPEQRSRFTPMERRIMRVKDFRRTLDYLEKRPDLFDMDRLAFEGLSLGGIWGGILPAIEPRVKALVLFGGGLDLTLPPECSQINFAPRIKVPVLMQGGNYDFLYPLELNQKPYFGLFGTASAHKVLKTYDTGHAVWMKNEVRKDELEFLDRYFGNSRN